MAHIAIATTGLTGITFASLEMGRRLKSEGHHITFICPIDIRDRVEGGGFDYMQLPAINFQFKPLPTETDTPRGRFRSIANNFRNRSNHYQQGLDRLHIEEYDTILRTLKPDIALFHVELHELIFSAYSLKIPLLLYTSWFNNRMNLNYPPIMTDIIPGRGFRGSKLGIMRAWIDTKARIWGRILLNRITFTNNRRDILYKYARSLGFSVKGLISSNFPPEFIYSKVPVLSINMAELDFPHKIPENTIHVGPMVYEDRQPKAEKKYDAARLEEILNESGSSKIKLLYCSVSTHEKGDIEFLKRMIQAVTKQPDWRLVISLGGKLKAEELGTIPPNVYLFKWLPQLTVLAHADCSINHGGMHSINECIHHAVPMLVYSGKYYDQNGCAARVAFHGLGLMGDKNKDSSTEIRDKIHSILSEPSFRETIERYQEAYTKQKRSSLYDVMEENIPV